jgi:hypothetical protein
MSVVGTTMTRNAMPKRSAPSAIGLTSSGPVQPAAEPPIQPRSGIVASVDAAMPTWTQPNARRGSRSRSMKARTRKLPSAMPTRNAVSIVANA